MNSWAQKVSSLFSATTGAFDATKLPTSEKPCTCYHSHHIKDFHVLIIYKHVYFINWGQHTTAMLWRHSNCSDKPARCCEALSVITWYICDVFDLRWVLWGRPTVSRGLYNTKSLDILVKLLQRNDFSFFFNCSHVGSDSALTCWALGVKGLSPLSTLRGQSLRTHFLRSNRSGFSLAADITQGRVAWRVM